MSDNTIRRRRWYAPAYTAQTGIVHTVGTETVVLAHAIKEARELRLEQDDSEPRIFVAFREIPEWQELSEW